MGRLNQYTEPVDENVTKVDKDDILDISFLFKKAYYRDTDDGQYWKVYGTFASEIGDIEELFFIVPASESRDKLLNAMNAVAPLANVALHKKQFTPKGEKLAKTFYSFDSLYSLDPKMLELSPSALDFKAFLADYTGITLEEMDARAEYEKVDKDDVLDLPMCIERLVLKEPRDDTSRPYWIVYASVEYTGLDDNSLTEKKLFFLPSAPSRDQLFHSLLPELPCHCSKLVKKTFIPKGQKEPVAFYAMVDTKDHVCACGVVLPHTESMF
jgi:hypothetical protein